VRGIGVANGGDGPVGRGIVGEWEGPRSTVGPAGGVSAAPFDARSGCSELAGGLGEQDAAHARERRGCDARHAPHQEVAVVREGLDPVCPPRDFAREDIVDAGG